MNIEIKITAESVEEARAAFAKLAGERPATHITVIPSDPRAEGGELTIPAGTDLTIASADRDSAGAHRRAGSTAGGNDTRGAGEARREAGRDRSGARTDHGPDRQRRSAPAGRRRRQDDAAPRPAPGIRSAGDHAAEGRPAGGIRRAAARPRSGGVSHAANSAR